MRNKLLHLLLKLDQMYKPTERKWFIIKLHNLIWLI